MSSKSSVKSHGSSKLDVATQRLEKCFEKKVAVEYEKCSDGPKWQRANFRRDSCGSGLVPIIHSFTENRRIWCKTPLSSYQASIGELGRKILCREEHIKRDVRNGPPCTICTNVLPPCRGFYRKYDCIRPCEDAYAVDQGNKRIYRDATARYWDPCTNVQRTDINTLAPHNVTLGMKLARTSYGFDCSGPA